MSIKNSHLLHEKIENAFKLLKQLESNIDVYLVKITQKIQFGTQIELSRDDILLTDLECFFSLYLYEYMNTYTEYYKTIDSFHEVIANAMLNEDKSILAKLFHDAAIIREKINKNTNEIIKLLREKMSTL